MRLLASSALLAAAVVTGLAADWPHYAGGPDSTRYSPLKQITPANVASLAVAWSYDTGDAFKGFMLQRYPERRCPGIFDIYLPRLFGGASDY